MNTKPDYYWDESQPPLMKMLFTLLFLTTLTTAWFDSGYSSRLIYQVNCSSSLNEYVFLDNFSSTIGYNADCSDYRLVNQSDNAVLYTQLENATCGTTNTIAWARANLSCPNYGFRYYTNPTASSASAWNVFDSNYFAVYHFDQYKRKTMISANGLHNASLGWVEAYSCSDKPGTNCYNSSGRFGTGYTLNASKNNGNYWYTDDNFNYNDTTLEIWFNPINTSSVDSNLQTLFSKRGGLTIPTGIDFNYNSTGFVFEFWERTPGWSNTEQHYYPVAIDAGKWHYAAASFHFRGNGTNYLELYYNGVNVLNSTTAKIVYSIDLSSYFVIGANADLIDQKKLNATIDEIRISNVSRNAPYFSASFNSSSSPLELASDVNGPDSLSVLAGENTTQYGHWLSAYALSGFIFSSNYSGTWVNSTWTPFITSYVNWSNTTATSNSSDNNTFWWILFANNSNNVWANTGFKTVTTVLPQLTNCSYYSNLTAIFFDFKNEENTTIKNLTGYMTITLTVWNNTETVNKTYSFDYRLNKTNYSICIYPSNAVLNIDLFSQYYGDGYFIRNYFLDNAIVSNTTNNITLYLLSNTSTGQGITFTLQDYAGNPTANLIGNILRYYPETNEYITVAMIKTDSNGKGFTYLIPYTVWYKLIVYQNGVMQKTFDSQLISSNTITMTYASIPSDYYTYYSNVAAQCTYSNTTNYLSCTYADTSGLVHSMTLTVWKQVKTDFVLNCTQTSTSSSGVLNCYLGTDSQNFTWKYSLTSVGSPLVQYLGGLIQATKEVINSIYYSSNNYVIVLIALVGAGLVGLWSPVAAIVILVSTTVLFSFIGLINLGYGIGSLIVIALILIWRMKS